MEKLYIIPKKDNFDIGYRLSHKEFKCQCVYADCTYTLLHPRLVRAWEMVRAKFGAPLKINSGFRCQRHNRDVGGVDDSRHKKGQAVDISFDNLKDMERSFLKTLLDEHFDTVLTYNNFYHCHID